MRFSVGAPRRARAGAVWRGRYDAFRGGSFYWASGGFGPAAHLRSNAQFLILPRGWRVLVDLFLLALGGLFSVPLYALIQSRGEPTHRARIIAANNILNALFMITSALLALALGAAGLSIPGLFALIAGLNLLFCAAVFNIVPDFRSRLSIRLLHRR